MKNMLLAFGVVFVALAMPLASQQQAPRNESAGKSWPPPRLSDGQPDVQGLWRPTMNGTQSLTAPMTGEAEFNARITGVPVRNPSRIVDPPNGQIPYQPWAAARQGQQARDWEFPTRIEHVDTQNRCLLGGVPRPFYNTRFRILQTPGQIVFVWDDYHSFRVIPLDGRPHVGSNLKLWMGDTRGRWEGTTLVTDVTNLNAKFRLSVVGDFFSENAHIVERMNFASADTMNYEVTITDPTVFTRPWTMRVLERRGPEDEVQEYACHEGDRTSDSMLIPIDKK